MRSFAHVAARRGRKCATILGPADLVLPLWERLEPRWGPARDVRPDQPLMACTTDPLGPIDPHVRLVRPDELEAYFPAAVAMFTEEVGVDPRAGRQRARLPRPDRRPDRRRPGLRAVRRRHGDVQGRDRCRCPHSVALIQGVWVHPQLRGRGLAAPAMAAVVRSDPARPAPDAEPVRQPLQPAGPARPTTGSGSPRSARSPRCCSDVCRSLPASARRLGADQTGPRGSTLPKCDWRDRSRRLRPRAVARVPIPR